MTGESGDEVENKGEREKERGGVRKGGARDVKWGTDEEGRWSGTWSRRDER